MGNPNRKNILTLVSIIVALTMIVPGAILAQQFNAEAQTGPTTYAWVNFDSPAQANAVLDIGTEIVSLRETGAYIKVTDGQRNYLSQHFSMNDMPERTMVNLEEQGISFDSQIGYELAAEWRNPGTNEYLVQFVAPTEETWNNGLQAISGNILREIGNNLVVVKMSETQKVQAEKLDYVQWVGAYEPGFKMDKDIPATGTVKVTVEGYSNSDVSALVSKLTAMGATGIITTELNVDCYISASALPAVARLDSVKLVWNLQEMKTLTNVGGRIVQAHDLWVKEVSNLPQDIMGQGQTIHIQDTGLDDTHRDFTSGPLGDRVIAGADATDAEYHGTHCTGIAAGNGYDMAVYLGLDPMDRVYNDLASSNPANRPDRMPFAGRAPECWISMEAGLTTGGWGAGLTAGARVFSNSWGPMTVENGYEASADNYMTTNPTTLVLFAAGNDGPGDHTVSGSGNGKLGIAIGAVENMRAIDFDSSDDYSQMASFSSRGPVADGRIKPDVVEIGTAVYATLSDDSATENAGYELYDTITVINTDTGDALGDYISLQGTSMACPAAAGDTILIRDYLVDVLGYDNVGANEPHGNLMKTLLIHGADDMGLGYPSYDQGWGRVNVRNSIAPAFPNVLQWSHSNGISSGVWDGEIDGGFDMEVIDNTVPLKVTMVHWDAAGSGELTYDLDLVVTSPSGVRYEGNAFNEAWSTPIANPTAWNTCAFPSWVGGGSYDFDEANDGGDDENNIEMVRINPANGNGVELGTWNVDVVWKESTARPFTVAMTGGFAAASDINAVNNAYKVNMQLDIPRVVPERDDFGEGTFKGAQDGSIIVPFWINNGGLNGDTYTMSTPILPAGFTATLYPAAPSVDASERLHAYARIMIGSSVAAGTYTLSFKAESDGSAAESTIKFQIDVVTVKTPPVITIAGSPAHEAAPTFVSWTDAGINYIGCAYTQDDQYGDRVYYTLSADGGATWNTPVVISEPSWSPGYVDICRAPTGSGESGRLMIAYNAWNPDGYNLDSADTRCSYVKTHYSDNNGATWTTASNAWALGTGVSVGNTYRTLDVEYVTSQNDFYIVLEVMGYTDTTNYAQDAIATVGKSSSTGDTWDAQVRIDPADPTMFYFFPNTDIDENGNLVLFYYQRDSGDAAQDRDATFQYYNGAWSTMRMVWDTTDNLMMPQTVCTDQGTGSNRAYGAFLKGANTDGDRQLYLTYTDNPTGNPPTFVTNIGPLAGGVIMSDHDYGTRFVFDMAYTNNYMYIFGHRNIRYDPYGQPNMLVVYDDDYTAGAATVTDYLTLDSYVHGKQGAIDTVHGGINKVFVAQNVMTKNAGHDIVGMHVYPGWQSATDIWGPVTEYVSADKTILNAGDLVTVIANVNEWTTGGNNIRGAQYWTDVSATPVAMQSFDGAFNSAAEAVASSITKVNTAGWSTGWHTIYVRGQDNSAAQNWGAAESVQVYVNPQVTAVGTVTGPTGVGSTGTLTLTYETEGIPTTMNFYRTSQTSAPYTWTYIGQDTTPMTVPQEFAYTLPGAGTYGFKASAIGGASAENVPPLTTEAPEAVYTWDTTPPEAPTLNTVDRYGFGIGTFVDTLTTAGTTAAGGPHNVYFVEARDSTDTRLNTPQATTEFTDTDYTNAATSNDVRAGPSLDTGNFDENFVRGEFATAVDPATITNIDLTFEGQTNTGSGTATMLVLSGTAWSAVGSTQATTINTDFTMTRSITSGFASYISGGVLTWGVYIDVTSSTCSVDYIEVAISYETTVATTDDNTLNWTASASGDVDYYNIYRADNVAGPYSVIDTVAFGTNTYRDIGKGTADPIDYWYYVRAVDLASNEETNTNAVQEGGGSGPIGVAYNIPIPVGAGAGDWVFVSFPYVMSGNIQTILADATGGGTTWDIAKWYDASTQSWKTYSTLGAGASDLVTINQNMGVWLRLTASDGVLTTSDIGDYSATPVAISMVTGWNLVGYPSDTARTADVALTGASATWIATYQATAPYIVDTSNLAGVTMTEGNAYWVYVTADGTWNVQI